jgi:peptidoglycan/LPS O-acetylase OafA/YrhL
MPVRSRDQRDAGLGALTFVDHVDEDGLVVRWESRRHRKHLEGPSLANLLGSVAFGVSAVAGYISPATGQLRNADRANLGTLVGAVCFLIGALLLLPERTEEAG